MITIAEAWRQIVATMPGCKTQTVRVDDAAGAVLAQSVHAERDQPPFDRVMMDGIAIAAGDAQGTGWIIQSTQAAGAKSTVLETASHCVEIMTGAAMPAGADTVIPVERLEIRQSRARLIDDARYARGQFVHRRGSDYRRGAVLLQPGTRLRGPEVAVLASSGLALVEVASAPEIAVFSVGDELVDPGEPIAANQIRRSNDFAIAALLAGHGYRRTQCTRLRDDPEHIEASLCAALSSNEVLVLTGGVSMGKYDYIPGILAALGVEIVFHKVAQKPGKPMWFGRRDNTVVFALPGNPVSALVCARRYVVPALNHAAGAAPAAESVALGEALDTPPGLGAFVPVVVAGDGKATPRSTNTSGDFNALAATTGFVELASSARAGARVPLWRW